MSPPGLHCLAFRLVRSIMMTLPLLSSTSEPLKPHPILLPTHSSLMFRRTPSGPERADSRNICAEPLLLRTVRPRGQLDQCMQRHFHPGTLLLRHVHVIRVDAPQYGLMRHDDDVLTAFQFHDDRLKSDDYVAIGFSAPVAIVVFVVVSRFEIFRVSVRNLLVGKAVADAGVQFVQGFPFELVVSFGGSREESSRLVGAFEGGGPNCKLAVVTDGGFDKLGQRTGIEFAAWGNVGVTAYSASDVVIGLAMLDEF